MAALAAAQAVAVDEAQGQQDRVLPPSIVNAQLDSLEKIALTSSNPDERRRAMTRLSGPGWIRSDESLRVVRYPGIVARLARIYRQSDDYSMRYSIIGLLSVQVERAAAVALLEEAAQEPGEEIVAPPGVAIVEDTWSLQSLAIGSLAHAGPEGEASLRRLHAGGKVRERMARAELERIAGRGFKKDGGS